MKKKIICALLLVVSAFMLAGCVTADRYTEEEHIAYMSERMRVKLIDSANAKKCAISRSITFIRIYTLRSRSGENS